MAVPRGRRPTSAQKRAQTRLNGVGARFPDRSAADLLAAATTYRICGLVGKRSYRSSDAAKQASRRMPNKIRAYYCRHCDGWHVTGETRRGEDRR